MIKKPEIKVVLGFAFGDEGKGNVVQYLCKQALNQGKKPVVIRFSGGPQSGHRVIHDGVEHVFSSFGSGTLLGVRTVYWDMDNTYVDPISLLLERNELIKKGINPKINFVGTPRIITPYDVLAGRQNQKVLTDGTCGKGLYQTFKRYSEDLLSYKGMDLDKMAKEYPDITVPGHVRVLYKMGVKYYDSLCVEWSEPVNLFDYDVWIFEGTQGLLLDMDNGFMPNCTPSRVGLNGIPSIIMKWAEAKNMEVYLVSRTYLTRHGNGYDDEDPQELYTLDETIDTSKEPTNLDSGYQGKFKRYLLNIDLLNRAIDRHRLDNFDVNYNLVLTHCDCLKKNYLYTVRNKEVKLYSTPKVVSNALRLDIKNTLLFDKEEM